MSENENNRVVVAGLPRDPKQVVPVEPAFAIKQSPDIEPPHPSTFRVGGLTYRVLFECGCVFERVFVGQFAKVGFHLIECRDHHEKRDEVIQAAHKALAKFPSQFLDQVK